MKSIFTTISSILLLLLFINTSPLAHSQALDPIDSTRVDTLIVKPYGVDTTRVDTAGVDTTRVDTTRVNTSAIDYSDEQLKQFVNAVAKVMTIQEEGQMLMIRTIQENEITLERFNEMVMEAQVDGPENITATEEEMTAFNKSLSEVQTLQMQLQELMVEAITEEGLNIDLYQDIMQAYEEDPEIKLKVDSYFAEFEE